MLKRALILMLGIASSSAFAGELVRDATVLEVANTNTNDASYAVLVTGGIGPCAGTAVWIFFPDSRKASADSFNQGYATALAALAADKKVRIHNFLDNSCGGASFIAISR